MSATTALAAPRSAGRSAGLRPSAPRPTRPSPSVPASLRLTRRGRLMVVAAVVVLGFAVFSLGQAAIGHSPAQAGASSSDAAPARTWVVQPGETLWSIAERVDPDTDPRETVARIVAMNDLPDAAVLVGQEIDVPA